MSYSLRQQYLTVYGDNVLQLICGKVGVFPGYLKLLFTLSTPMKFEHRGWIIELFLVVSFLSDYLAFRSEVPFLDNDVYKADF